MKRPNTFNLTNYFPALFFLNFSQLGNAYFYLQEYPKAFEYHKLDLQIACQIKDKVGEAKASGNLGNTLKVLGKFEEVSVHL